MSKFFQKKDLLIIICSYSMSASVYASQLSLWAHLNTTGTAVDLVINLMSAICASMANTAFRLKNESVFVSKLIKELAYGIGVGFVAGLVTYAVAEAADTNNFLQLALVTLAGWGGAKVIETYSDKYFGAKRQGGQS
ncbi:hypothetical protein [Pusillimonas sp. NJUB218]|uniref:hypothetical protein n=1 Tax=Pusillimonas sp. NJUB218 TaxID=2023230 RepID=UPI000F4C5B5E|nr:hypothetical protein [Pusillimonas sp. NJUB218]ROT46072.1 hypothetical protein CHR62_03590 [Pusillimonas sp. NJUB218]